jgi:hypothetical protein
MIRAIPIGLTWLLLISGCSREACSPSLNHSVEVPRAYKEGRGARDLVSDHERYVVCYEKGWWSCIGQFGRNIDYVPKRQDYEVSGWPSEVDGHRDGYLAAIRKVEDNIGRFGRTETQKFLEDSLSPK